MHPLTVSTLCPSLERTLRTKLNQVTASLCFLFFIKETPQRKKPVVDSIPPLWRCFPEPAGWLNIRPGTDCWLHCSDLVSARQVLLLRGTALHREGRLWLLSEPSAVAFFSLFLTKTIILNLAWLECQIQQRLPDLCRLPVLCVLPRQFPSPIMPSA